MKPRAAAIYCRISDDRQGAGLGVKRQEEDCRALADARRWPVAQVYVDNDVSAYSGQDRPNYRRLLSDMQRGHIDGLVVWHLDRLHRTPRELEEFFDVCDRASVGHMATVTGDIDLNTSDGRTFARIMGALAKSESEPKSRRIQRKHEELAKAGKRSGGGARAYGYERDGLTVRDSEAQLVQEAASRVMAGETVRSVCADWMNRGIPTVTAGFNMGDR